MVGDRGIIYFPSGSDLFSSGAQVLVNSVNCVGVMGKWLALEFKRRYPRNFRMYTSGCKYGLVMIGKLYVVSDGDTIIINFPTKQHWRDSSRLEDIEAGLVALQDELVSHASMYQSVAIPALGCGLGGLDWSSVKTLMERHLANMDATIMIYEPKEEKWKTKRLSD